MVGPIRSQARSEFFDSTFRSQQLATSDLFFDRRHLCACVRVCVCACVRVCVCVWGVCVCVCFPLSIALQMPSFCNVSKFRSQSSSASKPLKKNHRYSRCYSANSALSHFVKKRLLQKSEGTFFRTDFWVNSVRESLVDFWGPFSLEKKQEANFSGQKKKNNDSTAS